MKQNPDLFLSFNDLMAKLGYFLYRWSTLEQELNDGIVSARRRLQLSNTKVKGTFATRLDIWFELVVTLPENASNEKIAEEVRSQALALKKVRNLIVHGVNTGTSQPNRGEGFIRCAVGGYDNPTGKHVKYTSSQLDDFIEGADACRRAFTGLHCFNYRIKPLHI